MKYKRIIDLSKSPWGILADLGDSFKTQMKHSTHYCFAKHPRGNLAGLGDSFKTQMKHSTHYCFVKSPWQILGSFGDFLESQMIIWCNCSFVKSPGWNLGGLGDFLESQMIIWCNYSLAPEEILPTNIQHIIVLSKAPEEILPTSGTFSNHKWNIQHIVVLSKAPEEILPTSGTFSNHKWLFDAIVVLSKAPEEILAAPGTLSNHKWNIQHIIVLSKAPGEILPTSGTLSKQYLPSLGDFLKSKVNLWWWGALNPPPAPKNHSHPMMHRPGRPRPAENTKWSCKHCKWVMLWHVMHWAKSQPANGSRQIMHGSVLMRASPEHGSENLSPSRRTRNSRSRRLQHATQDASATTPVEIKAASTRNSIWSPTWILSTFSFLLSSRTGCTHWRAWHTRRSPSTPSETPCATTAIPLAYNKRTRFSHRARRQTQECQTSWAARPKKSTRLTPRKSSFPLLPPPRRAFCMFWIAGLYIIKWQNATRRNLTNWRVP